MGSYIVNKDNVSVVANTVAVPVTEQETKQIQDNDCKLRRVINAVVQQSDNFESLSHKNKSLGKDAITFTASC